MRLSGAVSTIVPRAGRTIPRRQCRVLYEPPAARLKQCTFKTFFQENTLLAVSAGNTSGLRTVHAPAIRKPGIGDTMSTKKRLLMVVFLLAVAMGLPLRALSSCADSPEDPTLVLALVAGAGALVAGRWRARRRRL